MVCGFYPREGNALEAQCMLSRKALKAAYEVLTDTEDVWIVTPTNSDRKLTPCRGYSLRLMCPHCNSDLKRNLLEDKHTSETLHN